MSILSIGFQDGVSASELSTSELVRQVKYLRKEKVIMNMENIIFQNYIERNDPKLLIGMQKAMDQAAKIVLAHLQSSSQVNISNRMSRVSSSIASRASDLSVLSSTSAVKHRINTPTKIEILTKERELYEEDMAQFHKKARTMRKHMKSELEEISLHLTEVLEAREVFEQTIIKEGVDPITGRIPAEKILRYMEDWLKSADAVIEKLRLRTGTLRYKYAYLRHQYKTKEELGETLHPVDLDILKIENQQYIDKLEQKNLDLLGVKKNTGDANLFLSKNKINLLAKIKQLHKLTHQRKEKQHKIMYLNKEIKMAGREIENSVEKLDNIKYMLENYTVPDVIEYVRLKQQETDLKSQIKLWRRKNSLLKIDLETFIKKMRHMTGMEVESQVWLTRISENEKRHDEGDDY